MLSNPRSERNKAGMADVEGVAYFRKLAGAMESGLAWLDARTDPDDAAFDYALDGDWDHASTNYRAEDVRAE